MSKILILDDERLVLQQVSKYVESYGYEYDFISKPKFLQYKLDSDHFDLILLDINMAGQDGISILRDLRKNKAYDDIAIIMLTGEVSEKIISQCFELGAADYITKPIRELEFKARVKAVMDLNDHIHQVEMQAKELQKNKETIMAAMKKINSSIDAARRIQGAMLPSKVDLGLTFPDFFVFFQPKDIVSGDFYWCDQFEETNKKIQKQVVVVAADCTGHGVSGAFMTALGTTLLKEIISHSKVREPDEVLYELNQRLISIITREGEEDIREGMEVAICMIDKANKKICFAGAKRPLIMISESGELTVIKGSMSSIGVQHPKRMEAKFEKHIVSIENGTTYYMISDGFQDQFDSENIKKYSKKKLLDFLQTHYKQPFSEQERLLKEELENWKGDIVQTDDILVMGFKIDSA